jgi:hypothetical protein
VLGASPPAGSCTLGFRRNNEHMSTKILRISSSRRVISSLSAGLSLNWLHCANRRAVCAGSASKPSIRCRSSSRSWRQRDRFSCPESFVPGGKPNTTRSVVADARSSPVASICNSGAPASTCTWGIVITCRTLPENGATTAISIFMASSTARVSPAKTVSPGFTAMETTTDGPGA